MENLSDNLLIEIFILLPCQSAVTCNSVCRRWRSIISTPFFRRRYNHHRRHLRRRFTLLFRFSYFHFTMQSYPFAASPEIAAFSDHPVMKSGDLGRNLLPQNAEFCLVASCNDILVYRETASFESVYYLYNPVTHHCATLPPAAGLHIEAKTTVGLAVAPDYYYNPDIQYKYKLICVSEPSSDHSTVQLNMEIFDSETQNWIKMSIPIPHNNRLIGSQFKSSNIICSNGMLYWLKGQSVLVLDPFKDIHKCRILSPPPGIGSRVGLNCLGICQGRIWVSMINRVEHEHDIADALRIWELDEDDDDEEGKWRLLYKVYLRDLMFVNGINGFRYLAMNAQVLGFDPNERGIVYLKDYDEVVKCDLERRIMVVVHELPLHLCQVSVFLLIHPWWPSPVRLVSSD